MEDPLKVEEKVETKPEETETKETKTEETKTEEPEKSDLEKQREKLLAEGKEEEKPAEKKPEEEFEVEEGDWDKLMEKYPQLAKLDIKSIDEMASKYAGGLEQFFKDRQIISELEKLGVDTANKRNELFAKLKSGADVTPPKVEKPETFADTRRKALVGSIPKQIEDTTTGELRPLTEDEQKGEIGKLDAFAEMIAPSEAIEAGRNANDMALNLVDRLEFLEWKLTQETKGEKVDPNIRTQIRDYFDKYPYLALEIVRDAKNKGQNYYPALYEQFILKTKSGEIDKAKKERWREEHEKELEKSEQAKTETAKKKGEPLKSSKSFEEMDVMAKRKAIIDEGV